MQVVSIQDAGRVIAYYPRFANFLGSVPAAMFLCQLMYWSERCTRREGVFKTVAEFEAETGLTYSQQNTARKKLVDAGYLTETHVRSEHKVYYKLDMSLFAEHFNAWVREVSSNDEQSTLENRGGTLENRGGTSKSRIRIYKEITTETTTQNAGEDDGKFDAFWRVYPRKDAKAAAKKAFTRLKADEHMLAKIIAAVKLQRESVGWQKSDGQFVPHASTWLNGRRWEDVAAKQNDSCPDWCQLAGFPHVDVARSQGCIAANAHLFNAGEFFDPDVPAHKRLAMREKA